LAGYLKDKCKELALITIPPHTAREEFYSTCALYKSGKPEREFRMAHYRLLQGKTGSPILLLCAYVVHFFSLASAFLRLKQRFDVYIGIGCMPTLMGMVFRQCGICRKIIYYRGDYFGQPRFSWPSAYHYLLIKAFHVIDKINLRSSNAIWHMSYAMKRQCGEDRLSIRRGAPQSVLPIGFYLKVDPAARNYESCDIAFIGNLRESQGVELFLRILPELLKVFPDIRLHIIGSGESEGPLRDYCRANNLDSHVKFYGFVKSQGDVERVFARCAFGIAPYSPRGNEYSQYASPGKVYSYLSAGLAVITTGFPEIAKDIKEAGAGIVINYSEQELQDAVLRFLKDRQYLKNCALNIKKLAIKYSWEGLLKKTLEEAFVA
jgi:glycosyltransferase involved in cell wall biosynthesis